MKSETEILGELDSLLGQLDDAARERVIALLHAKHCGPRSTVTQRPSPYQFDVTAAPNGRDPLWPPMQLWVSETRPLDVSFLGPQNAVCGGAIPPAASGVFIHGVQP